MHRNGGEFRSVTMCEHGSQWGLGGVCSPGTWILVEGFGGMMMKVESQVRSKYMSGSGTRAARAGVLCRGVTGAWERRDEMAENVRMWCSGPVVDWDLVAKASGFVGTAQCRGSCNPAHWRWRHAFTDRAFQPTLLSDINTHTIYLLHDVVGIVPTHAHVYYW